MIKIAICDDTKSELLYLINLLTTYSQHHPYLDLEIRHFLSPHQLLEELHNNVNYQIYLLDVRMPNLNGIELGREIRSFHRDCIIIFLTYSKDYAIDAYRIYAYQYLVKPVTQEILFETLDKALEHIPIEPSKNIAVKTREGLVNIYLHTIKYVEFHNHILDFYLSSNLFVTSTNMRLSFETLMEPLISETNFIRTHKSYVVNLNYVKQLKPLEFILIDESSIPISKKNYSQVKSYYMKYLLQRSS